MHPQKKRKVDCENRIFNEEWREKYFVFEYNEKVLCLICSETISVRKEYNINRHYQSKHASKYDNITGASRTQKYESLSRSTAAQRNVFTRVNHENENLTTASLRISHLIAKKGNPYTDGEFIKSCIVAAVDSICPDKTKQFEQISLSARTVVRRQKEISNFIKEDMKEKIPNFEFFSIAIDESTDVSDTAQLLIFLRAVNKEFDVTETLLAMKSLHGTTTGKDIFDEVEKTLKEYNLPWKKLKSITSDGGKNMCGTGRGFIGHVLKTCENENLPKPLVFHCIIHQQALCAKDLNLSSVIKPVVDIVNFIRSRGLNHRQFRQFLIEFESEYPDIPYHTAVRWLSKGNVLLRFFELLEIIVVFLNEKNYSEPNLDDEEWLWKLAFVTDIVGYLNEFNLKMQGKELLTSDFYSIVKAYRRKFALLKTQIALKNFDHFACWKKMLSKTNMQFPLEYAEDILSKLTTILNDRFSDIDEIQENIQLFENPFDFNVDLAPSHLQMEIIDIQADSILKVKHREMSLIDFYKMLPDNKYCNLIKFAKETTSIFGSTYQCEHTFSKMKYVKSHYRSMLSDENLEDTLLIGESDCQIKYDEILSNKKQLHPSH